MRAVPLLFLLLATWLLGGCAAPPVKKEITIPTFNIAETTRIKKTIYLDSAKEYYRAYLALAPNHASRPDALRRLADMKLEATEKRLAEIEEQSEHGDREALKREQNSTASYDEAIALYEELLTAYPHYPLNDLVLYQLARVYDLNGEQERSLAALDRLAENYRDSRYFDEAQFRRGEAFFLRQRYSEAEAAYGAILPLGQLSPYYQKALYKHGWSLYKLERYDDAIASFVRLLDLNLFDQETALMLSDSSLADPAAQKLLDDAFLAIKLSFAYQKGASSISRYFAQHGQRPYEFKIYQLVGDFFLQQERVNDAADVYDTFIKLYPDHIHAPIFQAKIADVYQDARFTNLHIDAKRAFVTQYDIDSTYWNMRNRSVRSRILPELRASAESLARHYHAEFQRNRSSNAFDEALSWYRLYLRNFPYGPASAAINFLMAELLSENGEQMAAIEAYHKTAYDYGEHDKAAEAGYGALLIYKALASTFGEISQREWAENYVEQALHFSKNFPYDKRIPAILTDTAEKLFELNDYPQAVATAQMLLELGSDTDATLRRTAWTVIAHSQFELAQYPEAEASYQNALALFADNHALRGEITERIAASIYKQGEKARRQGDMHTAIAHFSRIAQITPKSALLATAIYDAAAAHIVLKEWPQAIDLLQTFRNNFPGHALQKDVTGKLAVVYMESGKLLEAAVEFESMIAAAGQKIEKEAVWLTAELYDKAARADSAVAVYKRYLDYFPHPLGQAMEARQRIATYYKKGGSNIGNYHFWLREMIAANEQADMERTERTQYLAANAALELAAPAYDDFISVALIRPLQENLRRKKQLMKVALDAYAKAASYNVAEVSTVATFHIAEAYNSFGRSLMESERPTGLNDEELEQYDFLLEEQAYPFEEKSIETHERNVLQTMFGIYDAWIKKSYQALTKLLPARYDKPEKSALYFSAIN
ncbi:MAG: tetratricopeptide repeat protein [Gammaproteobacteria bacterium]|nr:tetratricopeptide repeat protein [Gammaproteobacteria bacterium]